MDEVRSLFVLYVADQEVARAFWAAALGVEPTLDVPGMTEFPLSPGAALGLMPEAGIQRLLPALPDPAAGGGAPRAELYLRVDDLDAAWARVLDAGGTVVSAPERRGWGEVAGYAMDPDGHVLAFADASSG